MATNNSFGSGVHSVQLYDKLLYDHKKNKQPIEKCLQLSPLRPSSI